MATGYDTRQATRQTFAFQGAAPVQSRPSASGASNGAQVVGGAAQGEGVASGPQTNPGNSAGQLGEFFGQLMEPYVQRRQKEQFFKGFTEAAHGTAVEELTNSDSPITKIFGATGYSEGAQFFTANTALDTFSSGVLADIDNIKRLPASEAAKLLTDKSDEIMSGDSGTNMLIQAGLIERMGPVMNTVAKARMEWQQTTAKDGYTTSRDAAATAYQSLMSAQSALTSPTDADRSAANAATLTYMAGAAKPEGMTDETYGASLAASAKSDILAGNFYAVGAMKRAGAWKFMDEETQNKLDTAYATGSAKALAKAAVQVVPDLIRLQTAVKLADEKPGLPGGAMAAAAELARINAKVKGIVGTDDDLFDYKDFSATAGSVVDVLVAAQRRATARQEQLTDMQTRRGWEVADKAADAAAETGQAIALWHMGDMIGADAAGAKMSDFETIALTEVRNGNFAGITNAYKVSKWVSRSAATQLQAAVTSSIGEEYNADVGRSHTQWATLYKASPATAAAYYGDMHAPMMRFDTLLSTNSPQTAFSKAFGNPTVYHPATIPESRKKEASELIPKALDTLESGWFTGTDLNASGRATASALLTNRFAILSTGDPSLSTQAIVNQSLAAAQADGSLERYGAFAWGNRPGTPSLAKLVGLQGKEMDDVFTTVVDYRLRKAGYKEGASGADYTITRMKLPNGHPAVHIEAVLEDGSGTKQTIITVADFKAYHQHQMDRRFIRNGGSAPNNPNPQGKAVLERYKAYEAAYPQ